ncbi:MAG: site-specific integrase [Tannerellaceae bacterium]|jgi:site-specific recombinase XerD|nr:site-specific integrase [Tannerellaceae bacterium]
MNKKQKSEFGDTIAKAAHHLRTYLKLSEATVNKRKEHWQYLLGFAEKQGLNCSFEIVCGQFIESMLNANSDLDKREQQLLYSTKQLQEYLKKGAILNPKESITFNGVIGCAMNRFIAEKASEHLRVSSLHTYKLQLSRFSHYLTKNKVERIEDIRVEHIILYIRQLPSEHKSNLYIAISIIKRFLKWLYENRMLSINLSIRIPSGRYVQQSELPAVYTKEEIGSLLEDGVDRGNPTGKRNYLVLLLAARLGLRASDICNLKFENIHWDKNILFMKQVKTGRMLELPLLADVGNAIIDYLRYGRPQSNEPYVVLTSCSPYRKLVSSATFDIVTKAFKRAGINIPNKKHGTHSLRHSLAARMLECQTMLPIISEVLGHEKTDSTMYYLRIDINTLSACMLDVSPVRENFYKQFKWKDYDNSL